MSQAAGLLPKQCQVLPITQKYDTNKTNNYPPGIYPKCLGRQHWAKCCKSKVDRDSQFLQPAISWWGQPLGPHNQGLAAQQYPIQFVPTEE